MSMDGSPIIDRTDIDGLYLNGALNYGGFKATPAAGWCFAHLIATDASHPSRPPTVSIASRAERFIDEKGAGAPTQPALRGEPHASIRVRPYCGERDADEFGYPGASGPRAGPTRAPADAGQAPSMNTSMCATTRRGSPRALSHPAGCPLLAHRRVRHAHARDKVRSPRETRRRRSPLMPSGQQVRGFPPLARRHHRPLAHAVVHLRRGALLRLSRRHARLLGAAGERRAPDRPQL